MERNWQAAQKEESHSVFREHDGNAGIGYGLTGAKSGSNNLKVN